LASRNVVGKSMWGSIGVGSGWKLNRNWGREELKKERGMERGKRLVKKDDLEKTVEGSLTEQGRRGLKKTLCPRRERRGLSLTRTVD